VRADWPVNAGKLTKDPATSKLAVYAVEVKWSGDGMPLSIFFQVTGFTSSMSPKKPSVRVG
jgi:hypothetical protein